jgi:integrase
MTERKKQRGVYEKVPGSGVWWIRYTSEGQLRREKVGTKAAAIQLVTNRRASVWQGAKLPPLRARVIRFGEICDDYEVYAKKHNAGWRADLDRIAILKTTFGDRPEDIPIAELRAWFDGQAWAPATYNRCKTVLRSIFNLAIENGKTESNPARLLKTRRAPDGRVRFLDANEESRLVAVIMARWPAHLPEFVIALNTGMRKSEQYQRINWNSVDFLHRDLYVPVSKNGDGRHITMTPEVIAAFRVLFARTSGQGPIFQAARGGAALQGPKHWFEDALLAAKVKDFTWHCLRHTFASRLVMAGVDLSTVSNLLGHKSTLMTTRYAHLSSRHKEQAMEKLSAFNAAEAAILISAGQQKPTDTRTDTGEKSGLVMVLENVQ